MTATWLSSGGKPFNFSVKPAAPIIDWGNPLTRGLVAAVDYGVLGGTSVKELVGGGSGTLTGTAPSVGPYGNQRTFNGNTDQDVYALASSQIVPASGKVSIEVLFRNNGTNAGANGNTVIIKGGNTFSQPFFNIRVNSGTPGNIELFASWNGTFASWAYNGFSLVIGVWYHVITTYDYGSTSNAPILYVNGVPYVATVENAPSGGAGTDDGSLWMGNATGGARGLNGDISYGRCWNRILSPGEVLSLYQNPWQVYAVSQSSSPERSSFVSPAGITSLDVGGKLPFGAKPDTPVIDEACELAQALVFDANYSARGGSGNVELVDRIVSTYGGAPPPAPVMGPHGSMMLFPGGTGSNSTVDAYTTPARLNGLVRMSVEAFFIPFGPGGGSNPGAGRIMQKGSASVSHFQIQWVDTDGTGEITCLVYWNGGAVQAVWSTNASSAPVGVPCHLVVTYDNSSTSNAPQIWINGLAQNVTVGAAPSGASPTDDNVLTIGNRDAGDRPINAAISYVRVYNRILAPQEARALYLNPWQVYRAPAPLVGLSSGVSYVLSAARGSIAETGEAASLKAARLVSAAAGSVALTGQAAVLRHGYTLPAGQAGFTQTGQVALFGIKMPVVQGSFVLSGGAASLVWTAGGAHSYMLASASGSFALAGQLATLKAGRKISVVNGVFGLTGSTANLARGKRLGAAQGSFAFSGKAVSFHTALSIKAQCGTVALAIEAAGLKKSGWSIVDPNGAVWTSQFSGAQAWSPAVAEETIWTSN